jgi:ABC-type nitrate/sulfonate/bicarbonate transport system substrate-binding protein
MRLVPVIGFVLSCQLVIGCSAPPARRDEPGAPKNPPQPATLRFLDLVNQDVRDVPLLMAFDDLAAQGYFIEKRYLTGSAVMADLLARGEADIAMLNNQVAWSAAARGAPIRTVSLFTGPSGMLAARPHVRTCADLHGRRVGTPTASGPSPLQLSLYIERHCPGARPQALVIPESAARAAALAAGRLDASLLPGEELFKLQRQAPGSVRAMMTYAEEFPDVQLDGLHVNRTWAAAHPGAVTDFVRAQVRAYRLVQARPERLFEEAVSRLAIDAETATAVGEWHLMRRMWDANGGLTAANVQFTIDFLTRAQALPGGMTVDQVADLAYLDAVLAELGRHDSTAPGSLRPQ